MTTNITSNLLNNTARTMWIVANNDNSAPAPEWLAWVLLALFVITVLATVIAVVALCKDDIEYFFWERKFKKNLKKK